MKVRVRDGFARLGPVPHPALFPVSHLAALAAPPTLAADAFGMVALGAATVALALGAAALARLQRVERRTRRAEEIAKTARAEASLLRAQMYAARAGALLTREERAAALPLAFRAQFGEDTFLFDLLGAQRDGFFIEVGAYDGVSMSVSYIFEALGWKGLLIEATPERAAQCAANRPGSRVVHAALGGPGDGATATFKVGVLREKPGETSGSDMLSHLDTAATHGSRKDSARRFRSITVPLTTLSELLREHVGPIDFASIDVEGGERRLLQGLDLTRHRPRVMLVEEGDDGGDGSAAVAQHLAQHAYTRIGGFFGSGVFVANAEPALAARARDLLAPLG
ncbi:hypothetical protein BH11PLA1_BH11PLA1_24530 [soil metagenome]